MRILVFIIFAIQCFSVFSQEERTAIIGTVTNGFTPIDTDGDNVADYVDSDSDNDLISDCNESLKEGEDEFKIERGVINKEYISIPYNKIQNVDIQRGLIARFLGLSDLQVQTAGYGATGGLRPGGSEGRLPGLDVDIADEIRKNIMKRVKEQQQ